MSNGAECCALLICCPPAQRREKVAASIAKKTGAKPEHCEGFLDWMEDHDLVFAPASFQATIDNIAKLARENP